MRQVEAAVATNRSDIGVLDCAAPQLLQEGMNRVRRIPTNEGNLETSVETSRMEDYSMGNDSGRGTPGKGAGLARRLFSDADAPA